MTEVSLKKFKNIVYDYYSLHGRRAMPWRKTKNPYYILISEVMLQQTQVARVLTKYNEFIKIFPTLESLAKAPLAKVLKTWQGLGYNRRARSLNQLAKKLFYEYANKVPNRREVLLTLPGIGEATSGAICAFAFNQPVVFTETNIRSVFIHHFFAGHKSVADEKLIPYIEKTVDQKNPREWYYALMDYGVHLKGTFPNPSRKSQHYRKQSRFSGSNRQIRGIIIRLLTKNSYIKESRLVCKIKAPKTRIHLMVNTLCKEGMLKKVGENLSFS